MSAATFEILPPVIATSILPSILFLGSITCPPFSKMSIRCAVASAQSTSNKAVITAKKILGTEKLTFIPVFVIIIVMSVVIAQFIFVRFRNKQHVANYSNYYKRKRIYQSDIWC